MNNKVTRSLRQYEAPTVKFREYEQMQMLCLSNETIIAAREETLWDDDEE